MGAKSKLDIETDQLHSAAGKAGQTLAGSVIPTIPPPPPTTASQLDIALASISAQSELLRSKVDTVDTTWATKQQAALTESPPVLQEQDVQAAGDYERTVSFRCRRSSHRSDRRTREASSQPATARLYLRMGRGAWTTTNGNSTSGGHPSPYGRTSAAPAAERGLGLAFRAASRQSR